MKPCSLARKCCRKWRPHLCHTAPLNLHLLMKTKVFNIFLYFDGRGWKEKSMGRVHYICFYICYNINGQRLVSNLCLILLFLKTFGCSSGERGHQDAFFNGQSCDGSAPKETVSETSLFQLSQMSFPKDAGPEDT